MRRNVVIEFSVLSSGSRGNCTYLKAGGVRILLDCGLSGRQTSLRLESIGIEASSIDAVVVTHEHSDHISGLRVFSQRYDTLVYANRATIENSEVLKRLDGRIREFETEKPFTVGPLSFEPFAISHDASDPVGFVIGDGELKLALAADLGEATPLMRRRFSGLSALLLEFNHDEKLLDGTHYPPYLKARIRGKLGHLSNDSASLFLEELFRIGTPKLQVLVAMHLSEKSNRPELARRALEAPFRNNSIDEIPILFVADAYRASPLFRLLGNAKRVRGENSAGSARVRARVV